MSTNFVLRHLVYYPDLSNICSEISGLALSPSCLLGKLFLLVCCHLPHFLLIEHLITVFPWNFDAYLLFLLLRHAGVQLLLVFHINTSEPAFYRFEVSSLVLTCEFLVVNILIVNSDSVSSTCMVWRSLNLHGHLVSV